MEEQTQLGGTWITVAFQIVLLLERVFYYLFLLLNKIQSSDCRLHLSSCCHAEMNVENETEESTENLQQKD